MEKSHLYQVVHTLQRKILDKRKPTQLKTNLEDDITVLGRLEYESGLEATF